VSGANLNPAKVSAIRGRKRRDGLRRNANGARDLLTPARVSKEMLA
jgi:hypothetical protein